MTTNAFARPGTWLRCCLHAHTTNSDGELPPAMLVRHYDWAGFDVLAITDHHVRTVEVSTDRLLVLPSTELDAAVDGGRRAHVLALGVEGEPWERGARLPSLSETVAWVHEQGGVPFIAHTYWSGLRTDEFEHCDGLIGLEVFNAGCELEIGRGLAALHWDEVLETGRAFLGLVTDDSHHPGFDSSLGWVWARCAERSPASVVSALREGAFYGSTGPEILELDVDEDSVRVRCSPARSVTLLTGRMTGASVNAGRLGYRFRGEALETNAAGEILAARLDRSRGARYGRIEVRDAEGRTAWTNPLWIA